MTEVKSVMIIEMMGRPVEHLKQVMKDFLKKIGSEKNVKIINQKIHKPKKVEDKDKEGKIVKVPEGQELYSTFAEVETEFKTIFDLIRTVFVYMPSHIEILSPDEFRMQNFDFASVLNEIIKKLHQYDAIAKNSILQNQMLANKLMSMQQIMQGQKADIAIEKTNKKLSKKRKK